MALMANHWCETASEAMVRVRGPFTFVDVLACLC